MIGKKVLTLTFAALILAFIIGSAMGEANANCLLPNGKILVVSVDCSPEKIFPNEIVTITCTTNMDGTGVVFIAQPAKGSSAASTESAEIEEDLERLSSDDLSWRIISYACVRIANREGGFQELIFPDDFTGLNGEPSTSERGEYHVFFVFLHLCICKIGFDCSSFFVLPEFPIGTLMASTASLAALLGHITVKRFRAKRLSP